MRRRLLIAGWVVILGMSAILPISALFHGIVHFGPRPLVVEGTLDKPIVSFGSDVVMRRGSRAIVFAVLGNIRMDGTARDDLVVADGRIYLDRGARATRDVLTVLGTTYLAPTSRVEGRLGGSVQAWDGKSNPREKNLGRVLSNSVRLGLAAGLALLLIGTCLTIVFPWQVVLISTQLRAAPVKSVAAGILSLITLLFLVIPLGLSLAGLPFALLLIGAAMLAWLFGITAAAVVLGRSVARGPVSLVWATAAGLLVLSVSMAVPVVGALAVSLVGLAGAGALAVALLTRSRPVASML